MRTPLLPLATAEIPIEPDRPASASIAFLVEDFKRPLQQHRVAARHGQAGARPSSQLAIVFANVQGTRARESIR